MFNRRKVVAIPINTSCYYHIRSINEEKQSLVSLFYEELPLTLCVLTCGIGSAYISLKIPEATGKLVSIIAKSLQGSTLGPLKNVALSLCSLHLLKSASTAVSIGLVTLLGERIAFNARQKLFSSLVYKEMEFFDSHRTNDLTNRLSVDVQELKHTVKQIMGKGVKSCIEMTGITIKLFQLSTHLTSMLLGCMPVAYVCGNLYASFLRKLSRSSKELESFAAVTANEGLSNMKTVKAFCAEESEIDMYYKASSKAKSKNIELGAHVGLFQALTSTSIGWMVLGILYYGGQKVSRNEMDPGDLMTYMLSIESAQKSLINLGELFAKTIQATSSTQRIFEFINSNPKRFIKPGMMPVDLQGDITFQNVNFKYKNRETQVLNNINLRIPSGKVTALCGGSGGGKSTIASLIEKFYTLNSGSILLDGINIDSINTYWLRDHIGYISQDPILFATSIIENIKYGSPNATLDQVMIAAQQANAHDFITAFPDQYMTRVGERGAALSGGNSFSCRSKTTNCYSSCFIKKSKNTDIR